MLINICFGFMMLIASLIDCPLIKRECGKKKTQLAKFDRPRLRVICFRWGPAFGLPAHRNE
jgi:hypothetical protein